MIGVFDSGIGGLTVVKEIKKIYPGQAILYFGDTARVPWGNKSETTVREYSEQICRFLVSKNAKTIVIACNTASAVAADHLAHKFNNIVFYNVVDPCVEAVSSGGYQNIVVIGTRATISSDVYKTKIMMRGTNSKVYSVACPLLVPLAEEGWLNEAITLKIVKKYLAPIKRKKIDALIMGCTHYPLLKKAIRESVGQHVKIINSAQEVARKMARDGTIKARTKGHDAYYFSDWDDHYRSTVKRIIAKKLYAKTLTLPK